MRSRWACISVAGPAGPAACWCDAAEHASTRPRSHQCKYTCWQPICTTDGPATPTAPAHRVQVLVMICQLALCDGAHWSVEWMWPKISQIMWFFSQCAGFAILQMCGFCNFAPICRQCAGFAILHPKCAKMCGFCNFTMCGFCNFANVRVLQFFRPKCAGFAIFPFPYRIRRYYEVSR